LWASDASALSEARLQEKGGGEEGDAARVLTS